MGSSMLHPQALLHDAASPAQRDALLGLLATTPPDLDGAAECFLDDPVLLHVLLRAAPLDRARLGDGLRSAVRARITQLGTELLTAWLLSRPTPSNGSRTDIALRMQSLHAAALARAIARACGHDFADDAALAALWSRLAQLLRIGPTPGDPRQAPARMVNARLADECGCHPLIADALMLADGAEEQIAQAHPLVAVVWSANRLAASADNWLEACARVCGLSPERLDDLLAAEAPPVLTLPGEPTEGEAALPATLAATPPRLVEAALAGFAQQAFSALDPAMLRQRYIAASGLLCNQHPLLVVAAEQGRLVALPLTGEHGATTLLQESAFCLDDDASVLALAIRSQTPTSWHREDGDPGRSVHDWQLARALGRSGFVCIPYAAGSSRGAIVVAPERSPLPATEVTRMLVALTIAAAGHALQQREREALEQQLRADIEQRHREHARRIAHEARNPLSVIRSYLHLIPQRHGDVPGLNEDLRVVQDEIERLGGLIDSVAHVAQAPQEPDSCDVGVLLRDLHAMLGEALFGSRSIHFELRAQPAPARAAMPASALRQVLHNLLHNAADTLHPGGRCTLALAGELIADGVRCIEIRVIDNGPGLPPERTGDLFSPQPSNKGGQHQGLGLAITREILEHWHARILCRSQQGIGTSFQLLVPLIDSE